MPRIIIDWLEGRSEDIRDKVAQEITKTFVEHVKVGSDAVTVVFKENSPEMQYKGGKRWSRR